MTSNDQSQTSTENSTALQAGRDINFQQGMTYQDVRQVAHDLFEANFYRLSAVAREEATRRAEYITEKFISRLMNENPSGFSQANDPSFQHALYTVQKEHARAGDENLADLLVDLLVDRSKQEQRDLLQLVLDESLATAPKLTEGQLANLAVVFVLRYTESVGIKSDNALGAYLDRYILPFVEALAVSDSSFTYLEFAGCGSTSLLMEISVEAILLKDYPALFVAGLSRDEIEEMGFSGGVDSRIFIPCLNDASKYQVGVMRYADIEPDLSRQGIPLDVIDRVKSIYQRNLMTEEEVRAKVLRIRPATEVLFQKWSNSAMKSLSLTSVGSAIGHANVKRLVGSFGGLENWVN
ncbi:LPO_1073/Vpar_1526 family protein [Stenotrophomonas maltophilia]|uniref:LPO_1073/Vpar_1526 family protein n=1 Tax=Stenotrophomonas maltophilia TaxID=40324 RepID=UPI002556C2E8|nr:LPO_1073/Vpar_1526 family protein [Stenotrophomonas maltophilia]